MREGWLMRKSRFSEPQIMKILQEGEAGTRVIDICRSYGISDVTFYKWREKYGTPQSSDARRLKRLEEENARLKQLLIDAILTNQILQDTVVKKKLPRDSRARLEAKSGSNRVVSTHML